MRKGGSVVISIDFELLWGLADIHPPDGGLYRNHLIGVREVIPRLLELFARRSVHATWATVGALACTDWDEYIARAPPPPRYMRQGMVVRPEIARAADPSGTLYFAPDLVELIARSPAQDLGSHTFNHLYMWEVGVMRRDVSADASAVATLFKERFGRPPHTFVFPRNQVGFTDVLKEHGIRAWRENPDTWFWALPQTALQDAAFVRVLRLLDSLLPLGARRASAQCTAAQPSSHFVRFSLPNVAFAAHRRRIAQEARDLRAGDVLHLWFHPHNLGAAPARSVGRLEEILDAIGAANPEIRFRSMADIAETVQGDAAQ